MMSGAGGEYFGKIGKGQDGDFLRLARIATYTKFYCFLIKISRIALRGVAALLEFRLDNDDAAI